MRLVALGCLLTSLLFFSISAVYSQSPVETSNSVSIHVVQRGETLFIIAQRYGVTMADLASANGISNINNIPVGARLIIPSVEQTVEETIESHRVQPGETLRSIADLYGTTVDTLMSINDLSNPDVIYPGQIIQLIESSEATIVVASANEATTTPLPSPEPTDVINAVTDVTHTDGVSILAPEPIFHTIRSGETLYRIAIQYGLTINDLVEANSIVNPTRIYAGQRLIIPLQVEAPSAPILPEPIVDLKLKPLIFVEGETGSLQLITDQAASVTLSFLDRNFTAITQQDGLIHTFIIGIPMFTPPDTYPAEFTIETNNSTIPYEINLRVASGRYGTQNINIDAELQELLAPAVEEYEIDLLINTTGTVNAERYFTGPFGLPAAAAMNSPFGTRRSYNGGAVDRFHNGADFASAPGASIYAVAPGRIVLSDLLNIRGNTVIIDHGWGVYTTYSHLTERLVPPGATVSAGDVIGTAGSTGRITGPHLHWEVWVQGVPVNPLQWTQTTFP